MNLEWNGGCGIFGDYWIQAAMTDPSRRTQHGRLDYGRPSHPRKAQPAAVRRLRGFYSGLVLCVDVLSGKRSMVSKN